MHSRRPLNGIVLDMDSSVSETYGDQEGTAYNGHFACTCYHPLFVFNQFGDLERCALRSGNVHSAHGWKDVLEPVVARYRGKFKRRYFRADAAFANPEIYEFLEAEGYKYAIRLPANRILQHRIGDLLKHPVGRPPGEVRRTYASFRYLAQSWKIPRRVVAKVEWHPGALPRLNQRFAPSAASGGRCLFPSLDTGPSVSQTRFSKRGCERLRREYPLRTRPVCRRRPRTRSSAAGP